MLTSAKTVKSKPKAFVTHIEIEPTNVKHAISQLAWANAMKVEYNSVQANKTWTLTTLPPDRKVFGCRWVFNIKENVDGNINKHKAKLVTKGYHQEQGFDFTETFSLVVKPTTIRVILTLAISYRLDVQKIDVKMAFFKWHFV